MRTSEIIKKARSNMNEPPTGKSAKEICRKLVQNNILDLIPIVKDAWNAREEYEGNPSIQNGSRRQAAEELAKKAIDSASFTIWKVWANDFKTEVSEEEIKDMVADCLIDMKPEQ